MLWHYLGILEIAPGLPPPPRPPPNSFCCQMKWNSNSACVLSSAHRDVIMPLYDYPHYCRILEDPSRSFSLPHSIWKTNEMEAVVPAIPAPLQCVLWDSVGFLRIPRDPPHCCDPTRLEILADRKDPHPVQDSRGRKEGEGDRQRDGDSFERSFCRILEPPSRISRKQGKENRKKEMINLPSPPQKKQTKPCGSVYPLIRKLHPEFWFMLIRYH